MTTLRESSMWISTNKKLSAEKLVSKQLADKLTTIMEISTPHQRNKYWPVPPEEQFKYQADIDTDSLITSPKRRWNIGCSTLKYCQVTSTPTISRIHSKEIKQ
jgi:hypothetical protein